MPNNEMVLWFWKCYWLYSCYNQKLYCFPVIVTTIPSAFSTYLSNCSLLWFITLSHLFCWFTVVSVELQSSKETMINRDMHAINSRLKWCIWFRDLSCHLASFISWVNNYNFLIINLIELMFRQLWISIVAPLREALLTI